jgi:hypothetical protein
MISYPLESLANFSFSAQMFYSKLSKLDIPAKQIILRLNLKYLPINYSDTNLSKNIQDLKKIGINIVCSYVNAHNIDFVSLISPYFVFYRKVNQENDKQKEYNILLKKLLAKSKVKYYSR